MSTDQNAENSAPDWARLAVKNIQVCLLFKAGGVLMMPLLGFRRGCEGAGAGLAGDRGEDVDRAILTCYSNDGITPLEVVDIPGWQWREILNGGYENAIVAELAGNERRTLHGAVSGAIAGSMSFDGPVDLEAFVTAQAVLSAGLEPSQVLAARLGGNWAECEQYPVEDWRLQIENGDTRAGYWDWVVSSAESDEVSLESLTAMTAPDQQRG